MLNEWQMNLMNSVNEGKEELEVAQILKKRKNNFVEYGDFKLLIGVENKMFIIFNVF